MSCPCFVKSWHMDWCFQTCQIIFCTQGFSIVFHCFWCLSLYLFLIVCLFLCVCACPCAYMFALLFMHPHIFVSVFFQLHSLSVTFVLSQVISQNFTLVLNDKASYVLFFFCGKLAYGLMLTELLKNVFHTRFGHCVSYLLTN